MQRAIRQLLGRTGYRTQSLRQVASLLVLLAILAVTTACRAKTPSLLDGEGCRAPCWEGLEPGKANADDVIATLESLAYVEHDSVEAWQEDMGLYEVTEIAWSTSDDLYSVAYLRQDTLVRLSFWTAGRETLKDVVDAFGVPASFEVFVDQGGTHLVLNYASEGLLVHTDYVTRSHWWRDAEGGMLEISPRQHVNAIAFFEPMAFPDALRCAYFEHSESVIAGRVERQQPWQGFGRTRVTAWNW